MQRSLHLALSLVCFGAVACGGDIKLNSGVDGNKKLSEFDAQDISSYCTAAADVAQKFAENNKDGICKFAGALTGALTGGNADPVAVCETQVALCDMGPVETSTAGDCELMDSTCDATAAEVEECFNASIAESERVFGEFAKRSCSELLMPEPDDTVEDIKEPPSCVALEAKCPELDFGFSGL